MDSFLLPAALQLTKSLAKADDSAWDFHTPFIHGLPQISDEVVLTNPPQERPSLSGLWSREHKLPERFAGAIQRTRDGENLDLQGEDAFTLQRHQSALLRRRLHNHRASLPAVSK